MTFLLYDRCLYERIRGAPGLDAQFFGVTGFVQIIAVVLALVAFRPECDCSISCPEYIPLLYVVPALEILVGIGCLLEALRRRQMAEQVSKDGVFTKVPTEMELTEIDDEDVSSSSSFTADNLDDTNADLEEAAS